MPLRKKSGNLFNDPRNWLPSTFRLILGLHQGVYIAKTIQLPLCNPHKTQYGFESTWNQLIMEVFFSHFWLYIKTSIQQLEKIKTKICRHKISILFNQICLNEEMLPKYTHTHTHTHTHTCVYMIEIFGKLDKSNT